MHEGGPHLLEEHVIDGLVDVSQLVDVAVTEGDLDADVRSVIVHSAAR